MNILRGSMALEWLTAWTTPVWDHPTKGMVYCERDRSECTQQATNDEMAIDPHDGASIPVQNRVRECWRACGYVEREGLSGANVSPLEKLNGS